MFEIYILDETNEQLEAFVEEMDANIGGGQSLGSLSTKRTLRTIWTPKRGTIKPEDKKTPRKTQPTTSSPRKTTRKCNHPHNEENAT